MDGILIVIVLYNCSPPESSSVRSLETILARSVAPRSTVRVLVFDNSACCWRGTLESGWAYVHAKNNGGIAAAYNHALSVTSESETWLLLLDQDSKLPPDFIDLLLNTISQCEHQPLIGAIVPRVYSHGVQVSPLEVKLGRCVPLREYGIPDIEVTALNSGTALRVSCMKAIGGFNQDFWLDFLDYWIFHKIRNNGFLVFLQNSTLSHDLSVMNYGDNITLDRYRNILRAEMKFTNEYRPKMERFLLVARLAIRMLRQAIFLKDKRLACETLYAVGGQLKKSISSSLKTETSLT